MMLAEIGCLLWQQQEEESLDRKLGFSGAFFLRFLKPSQYLPLV